MLGEKVYRARLTEDGDTVAYTFNILAFDYSEVREKVTKLIADKKILEKCFVYDIVRLLSITG